MQPGKSQGPHMMSRSEEEVGSDKGSKRLERFKERVVSQERQAASRS